MADISKTWSGGLRGEFTAELFESEAKILEFSKVASWMYFEHFRSRGWLFYQKHGWLRGEFTAELFESETKILEFSKVAS